MSDWIIVFHERRGELPHQGNSAKREERWKRSGGHGMRALASRRLGWRPIPTGSRAGRSKSKGSSSLHHDACRVVVIAAGVAAPLSLSSMTV
jgi:hypothetical protein